MLCEPPQYAWKPCLYELVFYFVQKQTVDNKYILMVVHLLEWSGVRFYRLRRMSNSFIFIEKIWK